MKKLITLLIAILSVAGIYADNYNEYLEASRKHLAEGNKEKAESCYRIYTNMTGKKDAELEKAFSGSAKSGNIEYIVILTMTEEYENGDVYEGEEKDGIRHGIGRYYHADGAIYEGEWKDDLIHGIGRYYYPDGTAENVLCENGIIIDYSEETLPQSKIRIHSIGYDNDDLYHGNMKDGKRNGRGTMHYADGRKYVGQWKDNYKHGQGTFFWLMGINMSVNGRMTNVMVKEYIISQVVLAMRANSRTANATVKAHISGLMDLNMLVNGRMTNAMDKALCTIRMS